MAVGVGTAGEILATPLFLTRNNYRQGLFLSVREEYYQETSKQLRLLGELLALTPKFSYLQYRVMVYF